MSQVEVHKFGGSSLASAELAKLADLQPIQQKQVAGRLDSRPQIIEACNAIPKGAEQ